jgi:hypothetical protein
MNTDPARRLGIRCGARAFFPYEMLISAPTGMQRGPEGILTVTQFGAYGIRIFLVSEFHGRIRYAINLMRQIAKENPYENRAKIVGT